MRARRIVVALVFVLLGARGVRAQADSCLRRSVPVNVVNDQGQIVTGLTENNFIGSMHHQPVKILSVTQDDSPRRVVIVLDASGSMISEGSAWHQYLAVAHNLIAAMPSEALAGLVVFSSKVDKNIPLSESRDDLQDELNALREGRKALPKGERLTAIWDALATADAEFDSHQEGDAIYAITDGGENASKLKMNSLRKTLLEKRIRLFTYLGFTFIGGPEFNGGLDLIDLSDATGGVGISTRRNDVGMLPALASGSGKPTPEGELLMAQYRQIFSFQRMEIQLPKALDKPQEWILKVTGTKAKDLTVVYPHKLAGCSKPAQGAAARR